MADVGRSRSRSPDRGGPPPADNGAPPQGGGVGGGGGGGGDEVRLYIGNLSYNTDENRLRSEFEAHGTVTDVFLPQDRNTGRPRGFGFVTYGNRNDAMDAISKMDSIDLDGRTIRVNESRPKGEGFGGGGGAGGGGGFNASGAADVKLYVGNLSFDTNETSLRGCFERFGAVSDCFLPADRDTGRPRGFAFVTMAAADAEKAMGQTDGSDLDGRTIRVNESRPRGDRGGGGGFGG
eukprot:CAMPEP_0113546774 /NCGR_PEP_ID=MMETSP0015_2-20120614/11986_1 /TAXON_ID=2838 /ORGANISM="Odontella" /LENGTH=234 /DNA_ID=CAMNT_0000447253 /DNA_START=44 /DNA_END=744 /DNA_ORIENTATION=- /assembly_acc=CAM_ASM_000160